MLFVNDIIDSINSDFNGIFIINEINIFLILFADDQVLFAKSPQTLQSLSTAVEYYCDLTAFYGETGRVPLFVFHKIIMIKYCTKIVSQHDSLPKASYVVLKDDADIGRNYNGKNWAFLIKTILQQHGFEYDWDQQSDAETPFNVIKQRKFDMYIQK